MKALQAAVGAKWEVIPIQLAQNENGLALHLDCAFNVVGGRGKKATAVLHPEYFQNEAELNFLRGLFNRRVIEIPKEEAGDLATNFLSLDPETILAANESWKTNAILASREYGFRVIAIPYSEMLKCNGSIRCTTLPLQREG